LNRSGQQQQSGLLRLLIPLGRELGGAELGRHLRRTVLQNVGELVGTAEGHNVRVLHPGRLLLRAEEDDMDCRRFPAHCPRGLSAGRVGKDEGGPVGIALHQGPHQVALREGQRQAAAAGEVLAAVFAGTWRADVAEASAAVAEAFIIAAVAITVAGHSCVVGTGGGGVETGTVLQLGEADIGSAVELGPGRVGVKAGRRLSDSFLKSIDEKYSLCKSPEFLIRIRFRWIRNLLTSWIRIRNFELWIRGSATRYIRNIPRILTNFSKFKEISEKIFYT